MKSGESSQNGIDSCFWLLSSPLIIGELNRRWTEGTDHLRI